MPLIRSLESNAAVSAGPRSTGDLLRQRRESRGLDLVDVAAALRIKPRYLAALEAGRPDRLPGSTYAMGFVRAYAEHLGLDGGAVLRRFKQEATGLATQPNLAFPLPLGENSIPGSGVLSAAIILTICGYGAWYYLSGGGGSPPQRVAEVPIALLPQDSEAGRLPSTATLSTKAEVTPLSSGGDSRPANTAPQSDPARSPAVAPARAASGGLPDLSPATAQSTIGTSDGLPRIAIQATADSWIEIRGPGRSVLVARLLRAGDSYHVPDQDDLWMRTGNAGGLEIAVDGNPVPSVGRMGMVRRRIALDPQALILGNAVRD